MSLCFERARRGDPDAIRSVVEALRPRLMKMAVHYGRCAGEDPDDLLQEAWIGLLEALKSLDLSIGSPSQYLIQCARWRLLDAIKRARVRRCLPLEEAPDARSGDGVAEAVTARAYVTEFVDQLKGPQQSVLRCLMRGLTWREAGSLLGCTSANIAYHVRQIRRQYEEWSAEQSAPLVCRKASTRRQAERDSLEQPLAATTTRST